MQPGCFHAFFQTKNNAFQFKSRAGSPVFSLGKGTSRQFSVRLSVRGRDVLFQQLPADNFEEKAKYPSAKFYQQVNTAKGVKHLSKTRKNTVEIHLPRLYSDSHNFAFAKNISDAVNYAMIS